MVNATLLSASAAALLRALKFSSFLPRAALLMQLSPWLVVHRPAITGLSNSARYHSRLRPYMMKI